MTDYRSMIGSILDGRYLLISIIGRGGSAVVFNAFDRHAETTVAIKLLNESSVPASERTTVRKQFANEVRALSMLSHPNIVGFRGANLKSRPMYFVMEYADGLTLKEHLARKKNIPQKELIDIACQILSALAHMHEKGVVHCDIKPHNIIILPNKKIKITDFGIAQIRGKAPELPSDKAVGTVYYVSPEQAQGKPLDHRSDIYSLGIMLYEISAGQLPFYHEDPDKVAEMHTLAPPRRPRTINPDLSKGLEQIILKAIAKKPHMRFKNARDMVTYLEILRKNPRSVFRLQERNPRDIAPIPQKSNNVLLSAIASACVVVAAIITILSLTSKDSCKKEDSFDTMSIKGEPAIIEYYNITDGEQ